MIDPHRCAQVLIDASVMGDGPAARKWGLSPRTIYHYKSRVRSDEKFAEIYTQLQSEFEADLAAIRLRLLRKMALTIEAKLVDAKIIEIVEAIKVIGEQYAAQRQVEAHGRPDEPAEEIAAGDEQQQAAQH